MTSSRDKPWRIRRLYMLDRQGICDDDLLHAIHGRGAMAAVFIEGNQQTATELLDELAGYNSTTAK